MSDLENIKNKLEIELRDKIKKELLEELNIKNNQNKIENKEKNKEQNKEQNKEEIKKEIKYVLKGKIKKFDENLFKKYDVPARELMKKKLGDKIKDNPDIYGEDMIIVDDECKYKFLELQACATWIDDKYPNEKPFVYERKGHFANDTLYLILNKSMTRGLLFDKESLEKEPKRIKKYSQTFVYYVPWNRVRQIYMEYFDINDLRDY